MKNIIIKVKKCDEINSLDNVKCGKMFIGGAMLNGGYACLIGDKEDAFKCYHFNCPLASTADLSTIRRLLPDSFDEVASNFDLDPKEAIKLTDEELQEYDPSTYCDEYMHQYLEVVDIELEGSDSEELEKIRELIREANDDDDSIDILKELFEIKIIENDTI